MPWTLIAALIIIGLLFLVLEILVVPGTTVVGIFGLVLMGVGIWEAYNIFGATTGHLVVAGSLVITVIAIALSLRSKTWKRAMLSTEIKGKTNLINQEKVKPGDTGKAVSRLVPMGKALINDEYFEVRSMGQYVDQGTEIEVIKIENNKIFVKQKN
jgi:membrane-bound ClpP family serine protease